MTSLYRQYVEEVNNGRKIIEIPDVAFVVYAIHDDGECFIEDMFVIPEERKNRIGTRLADMVVIDAKKYGCTKLTHAISKENKVKKVIESASNSFGFQVIGGSEVETYFIKEI